MCTVKNFFYQNRGLVFVPTPGKEPLNSWDFPRDHDVIVIYREPLDYTEECILSSRLQAEPTMLGEDRAVKTCGQ